jgi:hypothetical protein
MGTDGNYRNVADVTLGSSSPNIIAIDEDEDIVYVANGNGVSVLCSVNNQVQAGGV